MRTDGLPESTNIEDRRGEKPPEKKPMTIAEALAAAEGRVPRGQAEAMVPDAKTKLAQDAGVDDIEKLVPKKG